MNTGNICQIVLIICLVGFVEVYCITCSNVTTLNKEEKDFCDNTLIYSTANNIKSLNLTSNENTIVKKAVQTKLLAAARDVVYYTTYHDESKTIFKNASGNDFEWIKSNSSITSIAIDYITNNVYFTANRSLIACSENGQKCIQLKCCKISYVTLTPKLGWMFYTNESDKPNEQFIMRSNMNGAHEQVFIDGTFENIKHMTVDESTDRLYWWENRSKVYMASSQGIGEIELGSMNNSSDRFNSFVVNQGILLYSVARDNKIYAEEKSTANNSKSIFADKHLTLSIENLALYNSNKQSNAKINNSYCVNAACSGLCLLHSVSSESNKFTLNTSCTICKNFSKTLDNLCCLSNFITTEATSHNQSQSENKTNDDDSQSHSSFSKILFIFIVLVVIFGSGYVIYRKYTNRYPPITFRI